MLSGVSMEDRRRNYIQKDRGLIRQMKLEKLYLGTNLKMYKTTRETSDYLRSLVELTSDLPRTDLCTFVIPSFTALSQAKAIAGNLIEIGAQNMCWEDTGQFTGEISPLMLKELGIQLVEIGHSERRQHFGESDPIVNKKVLAGLGHGFTALICVGETAEDKNFQVAVEKIRQQVKIALHGVTEEQLSRVWIAYEPVWAIGVHGTPAKAEYANEIHKEIKKVLVEMFAETGARIPVLYGGSVNMGNAVELISQPEIDGLFIGRAAWDAGEFNKIIRATLSSWQTKNIA